MCQESELCCSTFWAYLFCSGEVSQRAESSACQSWISCRSITLCKLTLVVLLPLSDTYHHLLGCTSISMEYDSRQSLFDSSWNFRGPLFCSYSRFEFWHPNGYNSSYSCMNSVMTSIAPALDFQWASCQRFAHPICLILKPCKIRISLSYFSRQWFSLKLSFVLFALDPLISHLPSSSYSRLVSDPLRQ